MKLITSLTLFGALLSLPLYGAPVDKFSCQFQIEKDGAPWVTTGSYELYAVRTPANFGPPVFEGETPDPAKQVPGFSSDATIEVTPAGHEVRFFFTVSAHYAINKKSMGSAAAQTSCLGIQADLIPESTGQLIASLSNPQCNGFYAEPWNEDGSLKKGWNPISLSQDGAPIFDQKYLPAVSWTVKHRGHEYSFQSSCKFLKMIP